MFKKRSLTIITLVIILLNSLFVFAEPKLSESTPEFYVADYAGVLSQDVQNIIRGTNLNYEKTAEEPQVVVATVPNMQGADVVSYGVELFEEWGIGNKEHDNGVLLLLSLEERKVRIEVGYGLEGAITDSKAGDILDSITPDLSNGNYSEGLLNAFYLIVREVNAEYGYEDGAIMDKFVGYRYTPKINNKTTKSVSRLDKIIIVLLVLFLIWFDSRFFGGVIFRTLLWMLIFSRGGGGYGGGGSFGGGGRSGGGGSDREF